MFTLFRKSVLIIPAFLLAMLMSLPAGAGETGTLVIEITGFKNDTGKAMIALANSKETYEADIPFKGFAVPISGKKASQTVTGLAFGQYAVKTFHDENNNKELDTKIFGIPAERYGFSNDARAPFGPPSYEDAAFVLDAPEKTIRIKVKPYMGQSKEENTK